jgi:membrane complex biogenesis BtpA family protein
MNLEAIFGTDAPIVGMVHLEPLPGAPGYDGGRAAICDRAVADAEALEAGGVDAIMIENFGDAPFYPDDVPKHVVAEMTAAVAAVRRAVDLPLGVNVLRNDADAALSVAAATGASFVRVNVHAGARVTDQGVVQGKAHETLRLHERLDADVKILADLDVKHSAPLGAEPANRDEALADLVERGLADGIIVSGSGTGRPVDVEALTGLATRRDELGLDAPIFVGSGATADTVGALLSVADGVVVGTALKADGETTNPVDEAAVRTFVERARAERNA